MVKFLADECCDAHLITRLRAERHDVRYQLEEAPGALDDTILHDAFRDERILLTEDKDFGELVYRLRKPTARVILLRIPVEERNKKWPRLLKLIQDRGPKLRGHFVVVDLYKYRFRPLLFNV